MALAFLTDLEEGETEVNALLAGYFTQLMGSLLKFNRKKLSEYILTKEGVLESFISQIANQSISDFLVKLINESETASRQEETEDASLDVRRKETISLLIVKLQSENEEEALNACSTLKELSKSASLFEELS